MNRDHQAKTPPVDCTALPFLRVVLQISQYAIGINTAPCKEDMCALLQAPWDVLQGKNLLTGSGDPSKSVSSTALQKLCRGQKPTQDDVARRLTMWAAIPVVQGDACLISFEAEELELPQSSAAVNERHVAEPACKTNQILHVQVQFWDRLLAFESRRRAQLLLREAASHPALNDDLSDSLQYMLLGLNSASTSIQYEALPAWILTIGFLLLITAMY